LWANAIDPKIIDIDTDNTNMNFFMDLFDLSNTILQKLK